jgi:Tat protein secretion system quality control protein TatD with DNase activity
VVAALQVTPLVIDGSLVAMCQIVADVKGWTMQQAAQRLGDNFKAFYQDQL